MRGGAHHLKKNSVDKNPRPVQLIIMREEIPLADCCWLDRESVMQRDSQSQGFGDFFKN